MKEANGKKSFVVGLALLVLFVIWTILIQCVDVKSVGLNGPDIGFATINLFFHTLTGVHMTLYTITDWLGLVPIIICMVFGTIGFVQMIKRKSLIKVDYDIIILGLYYVLVILGYLIFEMIPINYRPILIDGFMEASYPSSTTLLVLSVMPTLIFQLRRRMSDGILRNVLFLITVLFTLFMVMGRTVAGVHWLTDIIGSILLSIGLNMIYKATVLMIDEKSKSN